MEFTYGVHPSELAEVMPENLAAQKFSEGIEQEKEGTQSGTCEVEEF